MCVAMMMMMGDFRGTVMAIVMGKWNPKVGCVVCDVPFGDRVRDNGDEM